MDSANSGSLQSSSGGGGGGDEDHDSRTHDSMSSFLNQSSSHYNHNPIHQTLDHIHTTFFDPYFPPSNSTNPNPVYDPNIRPDPTFTGFSATQNDDVYLNSHQPMYTNNNHSPPATSNANPRRVSDHHQVGVIIKNPKKRTRASRRAPTTVLTTDTTNFRQMVQEFTGIPTAPFYAASTSPFSRPLDLFSGGGGGGGIGPLYPLRSSAEKIHGSSSNYQLLPSDIHGFQKQPQTVLISQNPLFSFQSLLQTPQQVNEPILGATKSDHLSGFPSSSTRWRDQNENLVNFEGGNDNNPKVDGYKLDSLENVISSRNGGDQTQGNVDSWLCPSD